MIRVSRAVAIAALLAIGATAPSQARLVFVPSIQISPSEGTEIVLINQTGKQQTYKYSVRSDIGPAGGTTTTLPSNSFARLVLGSSTGIVAIETGDNVIVNAWLRNRPEAGRFFFAGLPWVNDAQGYPANQAQRIYHMHKGIGRVLVLNMGKAQATCTVKSSLVDLSFTVPAGELDSIDAVSAAKFDDAVAVQCNQPFLPFATLDEEDRTRVSNVQGSVPNPSVGIDDLNFFDNVSDRTFEYLGQFHQPTSQCGLGKKGLMIAFLEEAQGASRLLVRLDQTLGTFWASNKDGIHNFLWAHRNIPSNPFRENTWANINALGTGKNKLRNGSNLDQPKGTNNKAEFAVKWETRTRYLVALDYDVADRVQTLQASLNGDIIKTATGKATGENKVVSLQPAGIMNEFGNFCGQHPPEVAQNGDWRSNDFRLGMLLKD